MRIELRERTAEHARIYFEKTDDAQIEAMLPRGVFTLEEALANYEAARRPGADSFGRTIYADGRYVGDVWCYCIEAGGDPEAMLSFCLFEKALWGQGAATRGVRLFLVEAAARCRLRSVGAFCYADNAASARVLEKNGFTLQERFWEDGRESLYFLRQF